MTGSMETLSISDVDSQSRRPPSDRSLFGIILDVLMMFTGLQRTYHFGTKGSDHQAYPLGGKDANYEAHHGLIINQRERPIIE